MNINPTQTESPDSNPTSQSSTPSDRRQMARAIRDFGLARDVRDFLIALDCPAIAASRLAKLFRSTEDRVVRIANSYDWFSIRSVTDEAELAHDWTITQRQSLVIETTQAGETAATTDLTRSASALTPSLEFLSETHKPINDTIWGKKLRPDLIANVAHLSAESLSPSL